VIEEWRALPGYCGRYEVSNMGNIRSIDHVLSDGRFWAGRIIKQRASRSGYMSVRLCCNGHHWRWVHRLVLEAFVSACPVGMECAHNNGNPADNRLCNLRWDTRRGNHADKVLHGTTVRGERNALAKLTEADVRTVFAMRERGALLSEIASTFGVTAANVSNILMRKTWRHMGL